MKKAGFINLSTGIIILLFMPFSGTAILQMQTADQIYKTIESVPETKAALVLGAAAYPSRLSDILEDRMETAIELYNAGKVDQLIVSGAPNESQSMKAYALEKGVKEEDVIENSKGLNTMKSLQSVDPKISSVTIVTQQYHLPRALFIANTLGLEAYGLTADLGEYSKIFEFKKTGITLCF